MTVSTYNGEVTLYYCNNLKDAGLHLGVVEAEECEAGGVWPQRGVRAQDLLLVQPVRHAVADSA